MAEWSIAPDLKSGKGKTFQGSNPCLSVIKSPSKIPIDLALRNSLYPK